MTADQENGRERDKGRDGDNALISLGYVSSYILSMNFPKIKSVKETGAKKTKKKEKETRTEKEITNETDTQRETETLRH